MLGELKSRRPRRRGRSGALTEAQLDSHRAMLAYQAENLMPPTIREMCDALGRRSTNGVFETLVRLKCHSLVTHRPGVSRGWRAVEALETEPC